MRRLLLASVLSVAAGMALWGFTARGADPAPNPAFACFLMQDPASRRGANILVRTDPSGQNFTELTTFGEMNVEQFSVSPDGRQIVCRRTNNRGPVDNKVVVEDILILAPDGKVIQTIPVPNQGIAMSFGPPCLADPKHVGLAAAMSVPSPVIGGASVSCVLTLDTDGKNLRILASLPSGTRKDYGPNFGQNLNTKEHVADLCDQATWSPDGKTILCTFERAVPEGTNVRNAYRIWQVDADGSNPRPVAPDDTAFGAFSPDGRSIVYLQFAGNTSELFIAEADGKNPRQVTKLNSVLASPRWLSDGQTLEFFKADPGRGYHGTIWTIRADGANPKEISPKSGWSSIDPGTETRLMQTLRDPHPVP